MEIKRILKNLDVRISRLAQDLNISRPTLDTYIDCYESGKSIPNPTYQEIFDFLFDTDNITPIEFAKKFDYVKREILENYKNDNINSKNKILRNNISDFAFDTNSSENMLQFINLFIKNTNNSLVSSIVSYFNYVNGFKEYNSDDEDDKQKALYSILFKTFAAYLNDTLQIDEEAYKDFVDKSNRIYDKKDVKPSDVELLDYIKTRVEGGSELDMDYIKKLLDIRG